jgi:hypothetical protein
MPSNDPKDLKARVEYLQKENSRRIREIGVALDPLATLKARLDTTIEVLSKITGNKVLGEHIEIAFQEGIAEVLDDAEAEKVKSQLVFPDTNQVIELAAQRNVRRNG